MAADADGQPRNCKPDWGAFKRLLTFAMPAHDYSSQIYAAWNVKTDGLNITQRGSTGFSVSSWRVVASDDAAALAVAETVPWQRRCWRWQQQRWGRQWQPHHRQTA